MITSRYLTLSVKPDTSAIRVVQFNSRAHLVVPVVAMVGNSVVWPSNADGPEFVPISALESVNPMNWNDRACVAGHPDTDNGSANAPEVLEGLCFGRTFNACIDDGKLKMDAYLDVERAKEISGDAWSVVDRLQLGEMVEISIGALVSTKEEPGEHNGQTYQYVWQAFVSDHLAFLRPDERGACSNKIGCGAPRLNSAGNADAKVITKEAEMDEPETKPTNTVKSAKSVNTPGTFSWLRRILEVVRTPANYSADQSMNDLWQELSDALTETVPLYGWIMDVRYGSKQVLYTVFEDAEARWSYDSECLYYLRGYAIDDAGEVTLADDAVQASRDWVPVVVAEVVTEMSEARSQSQCECQHNDNNVNGNKGVSAMATVVTKKELISQLISGDSPFMAEDQATLETVASAVPDADLALLRSVGARLLREESRRRTSLVSALKGAQTLHTEEALTAMDIGRLEEMYQLLGLSQPQVFDYSGLGIPSAPNKPTSTYKAMDNSYDQALALECEGRGRKN